MKITIFSDCHLGFKYGEERGEDSFNALQEIMSDSLDSDLILIAGDLFDTRIPRQEIIAKAARILSKVQEVPNKAKLIDIRNKEKLEVNPLSLRGIPIVAINGNHDRRSKYLVNPIQVLENAGLLIHLDRSTALFEIDGKTVAIHGMGYVHERYAKDALNEWNPKPIENAINILVLHQSINPYIYSPLEPPTIDIEDLPKGFDLYIEGHVHWRELRNLHNSKFILAGSTTPTAISRNEAQQPKAYYFFNGSNIETKIIQNQRKIIYEECNLAGGVRSQIETLLQTLPTQTPKPMVFIKVKGSISKDASIPNFSDLEEKFRNKAIININKDLQIEGFEDQAEMLRLLREQKLSPEEHGLKILQKNLENINCGLKIDDIFDHLVEGDTDLLLNILLGKQTTLKGL
jgi:DNA repair exonuclease SbcCD nuclease subunit